PPLSVDEGARQGIGRTFQNIRLFRDLTTIDNLRAALAARRPTALWASLLRTRDYRRQQQNALREAMQFLEVMEVKSRALPVARRLPYGQQRQLEIARALATNPKLLLLDEPGAGMNPTEKKNLMQTIDRIRDQFKLAVLLIDHDMKLVMGIS